MRLIWTTCFILLASGLFAQERNTYATLSQETLYYLRKSYEELATYFESKGETQRAQEMRKRAQEVPVNSETLQNPPADSTSMASAQALPRIISPNNDKRITSLPFAQSNPHSGPAIYQMLHDMKKPSASEPEKYVNYSVNRYILSLIGKNLDITMSIFADSARLPGYENPLSKARLRELYGEIYATYQLEILDIDDFYQLDIKPQFRQKDETHVDYILYAQDRAPAPLAGSQFWSNFFGNVHVYEFIKEADAWHLAGIKVLPLE